MVSSLPSNQKDNTRSEPPKTQPSPKPVASKPYPPPPGAPPRHPPPPPANQPNQSPITKAAPKKEAQPAQKDADSDEEILALKGEGGHQFVLLWLLTCRTIGDTQKPATLPC